MLRFRLFSALLLLLGLGWLALSRDLEHRSTAGRIPAPRQGFLAPDFSLETTDGKIIRLSELRGQVVVLNFWTTWCPPCRAEMPTLERIAQEYASQGVIILGVNSTIQDNVADIPDFLAEYSITFPILLDRQGQVTRLYEIRALPTTFFIGPDGVIRYVVVGGPISEVTLRTNIK
ncbi:MAG: TlpA disulfide reductase family protein [Anaerolineales bacterium]